MLEMTTLHILLTKYFLALFSSEKKKNTHTSCFFPFCSPCNECNFEFRVPFQGLCLETGLHLVERRCLGID